MEPICHSHSFFYFFLSAPIHFPWPPAIRLPHPLPPSILFLRCHFRRHSLPSYAPPNILLLLANLSSTIVTLFVGRVTKLLRRPPTLKWSMILKDARCVLTIHIRGESKFLIFERLGARFWAVEEKNYLLEYYTLKSFKVLCHKTIF
jgi:hypothetical protein